MQGIETFGQDFVKCHQGRWIISLQEGIDQRETVFIIQDIEVSQYILITYVSTAESNRLVENRQCIPHRAISFMSYDVEGLVVDGNILA